jgi:thioredoxin reductase (NADPH)
MALLSAQDRQVVQQHFSDIAHEVTLRFFTQTIGAPEGAAIAKQILDEVAGLSDRLRVEEVNFVLEREQATQYGFEDIPAIALLRDGSDTRMRFLGAPIGYEFMSLVQAVALAGADDSGLSQDSKQLVASHATSPLEIKVFSTPT